MPAAAPLPPPPALPAVRPPVLAGMVLGSLALSLFFFSPHLWVVFGPPNAGTTVWARGLQFMLQCEHPFRTDLLDAGLVWRLAPALLGHVLQLRGTAALAVPWAGLVVMLVLCARLAWRFTQDLRSTWLFTALIGTTGATLTVTGWLGFNDAWYAGALLLVAFHRPPAVLAAALFIGPWIDERFLLGLPLAVFVHRQILGRDRLGLLLGLAGAGTGLYLAVRLANPLGLQADHVTQYLGRSLRQFPGWLPWTGLGWFMGLRAAWLLVLAPLGLAVRAGRSAEAWSLGALIIVPLLVITLMAADTSRAPTLLLPAVLLGLVQAARHLPPAALRWSLAGLLAGNVLMPAMHVTYKYPDVISMLPVEIARLLWP